jgi:hypothetical protein
VTLLIVFSMQSVPSLRHLALCELSFHATKFPAVRKAAPEYLPPPVVEELDDAVYHLIHVRSHLIYLRYVFFRSKAGRIALNIYLEKTNRMRHLVLEWMAKETFNWPEKTWPESESCYTRVFRDRVLNYKNK